MTFIRLIIGVNVLGSITLLFFLLFGPAVLDNLTRLERASVATLISRFMEERKIRLSTKGPASSHSELVMSMTPVKYKEGKNSETAAPHTDTATRAEATVAELREQGYRMESYLEPDGTLMVRALYIPSGASWVTSPPQLYTLSYDPKTEKTTAQWIP